MHAHEGHARLGWLDVEPESLRASGSGIEAVLAEFGARLDAGSATAAPTDGWRVLRRDPDGSAVIGAPVDATATTWRIVQVPARRDNSVSRNVRVQVYVHPEPCHVRPSTAG
ncbi:hypothetical protein [Microbacterium sp. zg-YB36]|uniref:hypothetical protein n=1 Tax=Microbacterium sp. zg-YB36 TaxID=2969407 RepID=UPI00214A8F73|nr:hypothetical protein [Microbacterium sp. zg-YB36]MDL5350684.1 hypothetical protein [Microbacterium sp. zg-YB36]